MVTFVGARALAESKFKKKEAQLSDGQRAMAEDEALAAWLTRIPTG